MSFDPTKPVRTRVGQEARIYATDGDNPYPIHGAIKIEGKWKPETWTKTGKLVVGVPASDRDLVNTT